MQNLISNLANKCAKYIGFETDKELGTGAGDINRQLFAHLGNPGDWSTLFCYRSYDQAKGIYHNKDDGYGFILEVSPLVGVDEKVIKNLQHFFDKEMPDKSFLQFTLIASHKIGNILDLWSKARVVDDVCLQNLTERRRRYMTDLAEDYVTSGLKTARNYRIFISFNSFAVSADKVVIFKRQLTKKLAVLNLDPVSVASQELLDLTDEIIAQESNIKQKGNKLNHLSPLNEQVIKRGKTFLVQADGIKAGDSITRLFGVAQQPEEWSLVEMIQLLGDNGDKGSLATIPARFIINYTIATDLPKGANERLIARGESVRKSAEQFIARFDETLRKEADEWAGTISDLKEGRRVVSSSFTVAITAPSQVIEDAEAALVSLYNMKDWELERTDNTHLPLLLNILPMHSGYIWQAMRFLKHRILEKSNEVVAKLPLHAEWRGVPVSGILLQAGRGQLFNWNPFYKIAGGNYNVQVYGPSGVGKSVLIQEMATTLLAQGAKMFILDIGGSYKNICELLGGEYIQFSPASNISLNPLSGFVDDTGRFRKILLEDGTPVPIKTLIVGDKEYDIAVDGLSYAKNIISSMCGVGNNAHQEALIEETIYRAIEIHGSELDITRIANLLKEGNDIQRRLGETLLPFTDRGIHGKYFQKAANITFNKPITVFELEEIANDEVLLSVLMQVVAIQIFTQVLCGDRSVQFVFVVDEAWRLLGHSAKFLAETSRTIRKYHGALVTCVQNVDDLNSSEHRKTIAQNSEWTIMLEQNHKGLKALEDSAYADLIPLIQTIRFVKGSHSEMMLYSSRVIVIGKLLLDPFAQTLYSTDADDFRYLKSRTKQGLTITQAVEELVRQKHF